MGELKAGFGYLIEGQRWVTRHGRWWLFGLVPGLITLVLYTAAFFFVVLRVDDVATWATPFADDWGSPWQSLVHGLVIALLVGASLMVAVVTFTAVTLLIGEPFYEALSKQVEISQDGTAPDSELPLWREVCNAVADFLAVLVRVAAYGLLFFILGFVPVLGQTVVPVVGFCVTGFFLAEELTAIALGRRGLRLKERLPLLRGHRPLVLGFGVPLAVSFLVPFVAVFLMPGAVAGATLLARDLTAAPSAPGSGIPPAPPTEPPASTQFVSVDDGGAAAQ